MTSKYPPKNQGRKLFEVNFNLNFTTLALCHLSIQDTFDMQDTDTKTVGGLGPMKFKSGCKPFEFDSKTKTRSASLDKWNNCKHLSDRWWECVWDDGYGAFTYARISDGHYFTGTHYSDIVTSWLCEDDEFLLGVSYQPTPLLARWLLGPSYVEPLDWKNPNVDDNGDSHGDAVWEILAHIRRHSEEAGDPADFYH